LRGRTKYGALFAVRVNGFVGYTCAALRPVRAKRVMGVQILLGAYHLSPYTSFFIAAARACPELAKGHDDVPL